MKQLVTTGIILNRTDFGEADRIITMLTPDSGKLRLIAKGVKKAKSRLAGGIELFSISHITYIQGRKDIGTLISARLDCHYGQIVKDINRTMLGYDLIKRLDKVTEDEPEPEYFHLLQQAFIALDDNTVDVDLIRLWFTMQLLRLGGHTPNLQTDITGTKLSADAVGYHFSFDDMAFVPGKEGQGVQSPFSANHIKFLRLGFAGHPPKALSHIQGVQQLAAQLLPLLQTMTQTYSHI